jgi:hypothetical protein
MKSWHEIGFCVEITGDGSPSLRIAEAKAILGARPEAMHHSGGACSETLLIYGNPVKDTLTSVKNPRFLVVGLGLGYIEMTIAREALLLRKDPSEIASIKSFEIVPELREFFINWLWENTVPANTEVNTIYDKVLSSLTAGTELEGHAIKNFLKTFFKKSSDIGSAIENEENINYVNDCILYDAFSSKTNPTLWDENFLVAFLSRAAAQKCIFSTYACRGSLKRALKTCGFVVVVREGFQGKRNSTYAIRQGG